MPSTFSFMYDHPEEGTLTATLAAAVPGPGGYQAIKWKVGGYPLIRKPVGFSNDRRHQFMLHLMEGSFTLNMRTAFEWMKKEDYAGTVIFSLDTRNEDGTLGDPFTQADMDLSGIHVNLDRVTLNPNGYKGPYFFELLLVMTELDDPGTEC